MRAQGTTATVTHRWSGESHDITVPRGASLYVDMAWSESSMVLRQHRGSFRKPLGPMFQKQYRGRGDEEKEAASSGEPTVLFRRSNRKQPGPSVEELARLMSAQKRKAGVLFEVVPDEAETGSRGVEAFRGKAHKLAGGAVSSGLPSSSTAEQGGFGQPSAPGNTVGSAPHAKRSAEKEFKPPRREP